MSEQNSMTDTERINACISAATALFERMPHIFLTEDDLRVHLCRYLLEHFGSEEQTRDGLSSIPLHTEVRWYGNDGRLRIRSDIVLMDVSSLYVSRLNALSRVLPSKGYGFHIPKAIIELKLRRTNGPSDAKFLESIDADVCKLKRLQGVFGAEPESENSSYWMVVLDKKGNIETSLPTSREVHLHYASVSCVPPQHEGQV